MKKAALFLSLLAVMALAASCGAEDELQGGGTPSGTVGQDNSASMPPESGEAEAGAQFSDQSAEDPAYFGDTQKEESDYAETEEVILLSDKILTVGDTMQVMRFTDGELQEAGLEITLGGAEVFSSPEEAGLDRSQMIESTENYDTAGNPEWCGIEEGKVLLCDLTIKNLEEKSDGDQHISEIMIAYADPATGKVTIVSCAPAYFSASSSNAGASDYYHYQLSPGESRDITVSWLIQENYEAENLYLCVTYDIREQTQRQYFRLVPQE